MADERLLKRGRANTNGEVQNFMPYPQWQQTVQETLSALTEYDVRAIISAACQADVRIGQMVLDRHYQNLEVERTKVLDFDQYSKNAWYTLNIEYDGLSSSKQFHKAGEAFNSVVGCITIIGNNAKEWSTFGTKRSALETLRKIGKTICMSCHDALGHEVVKQFQYSTELEDTMLLVVKAMTPEERIVMCAINDGRGPFIGKMVELEKLCKDHCIGETMPDVISL